MTTLKDATVAELEAEIARKMAAAMLQMPAPLPSFDFSRLVNLIVNGHKEAAQIGYIDEKLNFYIAETAIEAVYGPMIWPWRKTRFQ